MAEYHFNFENISVKQMKVLFGLSELEPMLFFQYLCTLLERAGIDLDSVYVDEMNCLIEAFMQELDEHLNPWSPAGIMQRAEDEESEQTGRALP